MKKHALNTCFWKLSLEKKAILQNIFSRKFGDSLGKILADRHIKINIGISMNQFCNDGVLCGEYIKTKDVI